MSSCLTPTNRSEGTPAHFFPSHMENNKQLPDKQRKTKFFLGDCQKITILVGQRSEFTTCLNPTERGRMDREVGHSERHHLVFLHPVKVNIRVFCFDQSKARHMTKHYQDLYRIKNRYPSLQSWGWPLIIFVTLLSTWLIWLCCNKYIHTLISLLFLQCHHQATISTRVKETKSSEDELVPFLEKEQNVISAQNSS